MNRSALSWVLLSAILANSAWGADITDEATVISWKLLVRKVDDVKQECWDERTAVATPQVSDAGRDAAAPSQPQTQYTVVRRCRQIPFVNEIMEGYDVTYRYNGMEGHTVMQRAPKHKIKVGISALPGQ